MGLTRFSTGQFPGSAALFARGEAPGLKPFQWRGRFRWAEAQRFHGGATGSVRGQGKCRRDRREHFERTAAGTLASR